MVVLWKYFTIQVIERTENDDDGILFFNYLGHLLFLLICITVYARLLSVVDRDRV